MNRLAGETSPYLLQHRDNPVHWWPWCDEAFAEAARTERPVLLSVGYAACHWCHVMAHESFEDPDTAAVMNELFVNVKVDREERPDVDHVYMSALQALGVPGGWPLTMFLTPDRRPFWGGTYFPPAGAHGRPGFTDVLRTMSAVFRSEPDRVETSADAIRDALAGLAAAHAGSFPDAALLDDAAARIAAAHDPVVGGFRGAPKFPNFPALDLLWRRGLADSGAAFRAPVLAALEGMSRGGIYDHLGGGIARYTVDDRWLVPHFEKMLYDNALYLRALARTWRATRLPMLAARARETAAWMLDEMRTGPAFASSFDADSEGEEGRYYVWDAAEIDDVLGADAARFRAAYGVRDGGNWEGKNILHRLEAGPWSEEEDAALRPLRERLLARRRERTPPGFDDKVLCDWNGLAVAALAEAGATFGVAAWVEAARAAFGFVATEMARGERLLHAWRAGAARHSGMLDDYAFLADAALALHDAGALPEGPARAAAWMDVLGARFAAGGGGYWRTADDAEALVARSRASVDDATPSGAGVAADVQARLWQLTGESRWREAAEGAVAASMDAAARAPAAFPTLLAAADTLLDAVQVVVEPGDDAARGTELLRTARAAPPVARTIRALAPGETLHEGHPARGMAPGGGAARAYVCRGSSCSLPVTEPAALAELLGAPAAPVVGEAGGR